MCILCLSQAMTNYNPIETLGKSKNNPKRIKTTKWWQGKSDLSCTAKLKTKTLKGENMCNQIYAKKLHKLVKCIEKEWKDTYHIVNND